MRAGLCPRDLAGGEASGNRGECGRAWSRRTGAGGQVFPGEAGLVAGGGGGQEAQPRGWVLGPRRASPGHLVMRPGPGEGRRWWARWAYQRQGFGGAEGASKMIKKCCAQENLEAGNNQEGLTRGARSGLGTSRF